MVTYPDIQVLIDKFIVEFNTAIVSGLPWLNNLLGNVQEITKVLDGSLTKLPAMHTSDGEYIEVFPDDTFINYSWFNFAQIQLNGRKRQSKFKVTADFNLFFDLNNIYPGVTASRNLENVKKEVYEALLGLSLMSGALRVKQISDRYTDVYKGFKLNSVEDKYFMQPYAGINIQLDVYLRASCEIEYKTDNFISTDIPGINIEDNFSPIGAETIKVN